MYCIREGYTYINIVPQLDVTHVCYIRLLDQVLGANQDDSNQVRLKDFHQYSQADDAQSIHTISTMEGIYLHKSIRMLSLFSVII